MHAMRLLRTLRHLRARQLAAQLRARLPRAPAARHRSEPAPPLRWGEVRFAPPLAAGHPGADEIARGALRFLNRSAQLGFPPDWNRADLPALWLYNLHYHDFLWALDFAAARAAALDWIARHPPGRRRIGWAPYPASLRVGNWCALFFGRHRRETVADAAFAAALWTSIRDQMRHLERNLEWHLLANHLLENAVALALAGSCFAHPAAARWRDRGCALLEAELARQVLADGGHFERSPMYQCRVLHALRMLAATGDAQLAALAAPAIERLAAALARLTHPDGGIALLNDSAFGIYPDARALGCPPPPQGAFALPQTGYYGARDADGNYVVCDAGPLGPDFQPGHGHADLFSFELSLRGARVVVDSGVSTYAPGAMRDYCRSTRAHNTVVVDGADQAELWGAFRVGRRPRPQGVDWRPLRDGFVLAGSHDGYRQLPAAALHARVLRYCTGARTGGRAGGRLSIRDRVEARAPARIAARLHFHPRWRIRDLSSLGNCVLEDAGGGSVRIAWSGWHRAQVEESIYCPGFGIEEANHCLALSSTVAMLAGSIDIEAQ